MLLCILLPNLICWRPDGSIKKSIYLHTNKIDNRTFNNNIIKLSQSPVFPTISIHTNTSQYLFHFMWSNDELMSQMLQLLNNRHDVFLCPLPSAILEHLKRRRSNHIMSIPGSLVSNLVVVGLMPEVIELTEPFVHSEVVKSDVGDHLLLDLVLRLVLGVVLRTQWLQLSVSIQTLLDVRIKILTKLLDEVGEWQKIAQWSLGGLVKELANKGDGLGSGLVVEAWDDGGGLGQFVLLEEPVEELLEFFSVSEGEGTHEKHKEYDSFHG